MTNALYIGSTHPSAGKNTLALGLALSLRQQNISCAWMKPLGSLPVPHAESAEKLMEDEDTLFMREALNLGAESVPPSSLLLTQDLNMKAVGKGLEDPLPGLRASVEALFQSHDLTMLCGAGSLEAGEIFNFSALRIIRELNLKLLLLDRATRQVHLDRILFIRELLGDAMLGVVLNAVPHTLTEDVESRVKPFLESRGIPVLGTIPHDPLLSSLQVSQIMDHLSAHLLTTAGKTTRMVENFLIGTMQVENFMAHYRRTPKAAVIVGGDRADVQMVAIEGGSSCLILTGNFYPGDIILSRADALEIPILVTRDDTFTAARKVEALFTRNKLRDPAKVTQGAHLVSAHLDFQALRRALDI